MAIPIRYQKRQDFISMSAAIVCLLHCVALPFFFITVAVWDMEVLENIWLELATITISFFIGGIAIWRGYKYHHHKGRVLFYFLAGMLIMIAGNYLGGKMVEIKTKVTGATVMIIAHAINLKSSHQIAYKKLYAKYMNYDSNKLYGMAPLH